MGSRVWRPKLILLTRWRMIFISLLSKLRTHHPMVSHILVRPHTSLGYHRCLPSPNLHIMSSLDNIHNPNPHYTPPPKHPSSLHELQVKFHALRKDIHKIRDDLTGLHSTIEESLNIHGTQINSLHHHHSNMMTTFDRRFISIKTHSDDLKTRLRYDIQALSLRLDCHDK